MESCIAVLDDLFDTLHKRIDASLVLEILAHSLCICLLLLALFTTVQY